MILTAARCRHCRRPLGANNRSRVCARCRVAALCPVCGLIRVAGSAWCRDCRAGVALAARVVDDNPGVRPGAALAAERVELYRGLAERGLPLTPPSVAECGEAPGPESRPGEVREVSCTLPYREVRLAAGLGGGRPPGNGA